MSQDGAITLVRDEAAWQGRVGEFDVRVDRSEDGGSLILRPAQGEPLVVRITKDALEFTYGGPAVRFSAPGADLELSARNVDIRAEDTVTVHGGREVDLHSGEDVEIRADHQVNLWAHGVLVGD